MTFSVPKSVSALWAIGDAEVRRQIEQAFDIAVKKTLKWLERNVELARSGRAGKRQVAAKLVVATFDHFVNRSRSWEPHRHRHCVIANMAQRPDGSWAAVNSRELRKWIRALGPLMNVEFAAQLQQRLGLVLERPKDERGRDASWFEAAGVPKSLCKQWSSRHTELHELLDGQTIKMDHSTAQARDLAFQLSRGKKLRTPPVQELTVRLDRQPHTEPGQRPKKQVVTVSLKALQKTVREPGDQAVSLAYAATTHKLQGGSTEVAYMLVGGQMTDRQMSYTQATRGVQKTIVFVDKLHAGEDLKDLAKSMNKSRPKHMAHDLAKKPKYERGQTLRHEITREL